MLGGKFYIPSMDPRGSLDPSTGQLAIATSPTSWSVVTSCNDPVPEHVFDVAETIDGLWLFGSSGDNSVVWRSTDDGATWTAALTVAGSGFARFYCVLTFGDTMLALFRDDPGGLGTTVDAYRWNPGDTAWTQLADFTDIGTGIAVSGNPAPFTVAGVDYWLVTDQAKATGGAGSLAIGIATLPEHAPTVPALMASLPFTSVYDAANDGAGHLYVLSGDNQLWRCDTTGAWMHLLDLAVGNNARSLAIDTVNGNLWFGTADSRIVPHPIPA